MGINSKQAAFASNMAKAVKGLVPSLATASILTVGLVTNATAGSLINNNTVMLGVDDFGQLNIFGGTPSSGSGTRYVGLRYLPTGADAVAPGCLCEGWGVADFATGITGYANNAPFLGSFGLTAQSFTQPNPDEALLSVKVGETFLVTHHYKPTAETDYLYEDLVTIKNIGTTTVNDLRFRRVVDWDVEPTFFNEHVTIDRTAMAANVLFASNNGFASSNPLVPGGNLGATGDFEDFGPMDQGALFDFGFGALGAGEEFSFTTFYGAAPTEAAALGALGAVSAEVYSFGQTADGAVTGEPNTFILGFKGVGGKPIPEPSSMLSLFALGAFGAGSSVLKRK
ncbi:MAG: PEP-CTERM sorting domain-containing protein [Cyanobacteria bacterium P01_G01_bin.54]